MKTLKERTTGKPAGDTPFYIKKAEAYSPDWEGEWARVQRMRKEGHPLIKGGRYRKRQVSLKGGEIKKW